MSRNSIIVLGIAVVLLTAWLVIAVAYQLQTADADNAADNAATSQEPYVSKNTGSPASSSNTSAVETSVDIANNQVETSVTVE